jgi:Protein of unknown function (DUF2631)
VVNTEVERSTDVDPADVPSANWGWSKINHRTWYAVGVFIIGFLLLTLRGNHVGKVEDIFVIMFAVLAAGVLIRDIVSRRKGTLR